MSKIFGIGEDGLEPWTNWNFVSDSNNNPYNNPAIRWSKAGIGLQSNENVLLWRTWIQMQGLQRELNSLSDSSKQEINDGFFRINGDYQGNTNGQFEFVNQSTEYKSLYESFLLFLNTI